MVESRDVSFKTRILSEIFLFEPLRLLRFLNCPHWIVLDALEGRSYKLSLERSFRDLSNDPITWFLMHFKIFKLSLPPHSWRWGIVALYQKIALLGQKNALDVL